MVGVYIHEIVATFFNTLESEGGGEEEGANGFSIEWMLKQMLRPFPLVFDTR